jgi:hypothetical protein
MCPVNMSAEPPSSLEFLEQWRISAGRHGTYFANHGGRSTLALRTCGLGAPDRERLLLKSRRWEARAMRRTPDGTWVGTYAARLTVPAVTVWAQLAYDPDGPARCERFWREMDGAEATEHDLPTHPGAIHTLVKAQRFTAGDAEGHVRSWATGHATAAPDRMYSTTEQETSNLCRLLCALRTQRGIPYPEDILAFLDHDELMWRIKPHELSLALGWDGRRVKQLLRGAWPSATEAAQLRALERPHAILEQLVRRFPHRYEITDHPWPVGPKIDLGRMYRGGSFAPFAVGPDERSMFTGYRRFSLDRLGQLANNLGYAGRPDLARFWLLVFLCDADAYYRRGQGFTGLRYRWTDDGPVPEQGETHLAALCARNVIRISGRGERAVVHAHAFFYPPDLGIQFEADALELRLPKDWKRLSREALLAHCRAWMSAAHVPDAHGWLDYDTLLGTGGTQ